MSWVTVIWSMIASACFTLGLGNALVWSRRREARAHALFAVLAVATGLVAIIELWMMRAATPEEFGLALRWFHVPGWMIILSLVGFVRLYLRAGRAWLAWTVCGVRTLSLILNFAFTPNLNFREITALRHIRFLGEAVSLPEGVQSPWMLVGQASFLLLVIFVVDAMVTLWRRGERFQTWLLGGAIVFFVVAGAGEVTLALWGIIAMPITASVFFLGIVAAMGWEMSEGVLRALKLSEELRESEERLTLAAEAAGIGVWMWNIARNQVWASERWRRLFGFTPDETVTFETVIQRIHAEDREMVECEVRRAMESRADYAGEYRVVLPDGTQRWVAARGRVYPDVKGKPARMVGASLDITQRKLAEAALKESEERFRHVAETVGEFIWEVDTQGLYTYASPSVAETLGYTPEELVGKKYFYDLFEPSVREELKAATFQAFAARRVFRDFPNPSLSKSGKLVHLQSSGTPVLGPAGQLVGYRGADTDVTARKQAELEIVQQRNEMAHIARVSMMGQLASSLAHELNQPLGAILRNAEAAELFLQEASPDLDEVRAILVDIRKDDQRAGAVIDGMRAMIKRREVERCRLDLDQLVGEVVSLLGPDAELRQVGLSLQTGPGLPPVVGDRVQLQQVLLNLLLNAMDSLNDVPPAKRFVAVRAWPAGATVKVAVSDNGHGIAEDKLPRVFEPFFTSKPDGLGMGLAISRSIIEAHCGRLWAENNAAGGATFTFTLPVDGEGQVASGEWRVARGDKGERGEWCVMSSGNLEQFGAYQKALELFDRVVEDMTQFLADRRLERLVSQQLASADSVCSNIEEGYGRESTVEYRRFLIVARGSLRETQGRYGRLRHWIPAETVAHRVALAEEVDRILSATIKHLTTR